MVEIFRNSPPFDWLLAVFAAGFLLMLFIRGLFPSFFSIIGMRRFFLQGKGRAESSSKSLDLLLSGSINVLYLLGISILIDVSLRNSYPVFKDFRFFLYVFASVGGLFLLKYLADNLIATVFSIRPVYQTVRTDVFRFRLLASAVLFFGCFICHYSFLNPYVLTPGVLLGVTGIGFLVLNLILGKYFIGRADHFLFFIFYLCTIEIFPVLILVGIILKNNILT